MMHHAPRVPPITDQHSINRSFVWLYERSIKQRIGGTVNPSSGVTEQNGVANDLPPLLPPWFKSVIRKNCQWCTTYSSPLNNRSFVCLRSVLGSMHCTAQRVPSFISGTMEQTKLFLKWCFSIRIQKLHLKYSACSNNIIPMEIRKRSVQKQAQL